MTIIDIARPETLKEITGLERPSAIKRFLDSKRIPYMPGADGWPRVLSAVLIEKLGGKVESQSSNEPQLRLKHG
jgi:hypothetical protein